MTTEQRLERIEKQNAKMKVAVAGMAVVVAVALLLGAGQEKEKPKVWGEVRARHFVLVDGKNRGRGEWWAGQHATHLHLCDGKGRIGIRLDLNDNGNTSIYFKHRKGYMPIVLSVDEDGRTMVHVVGREAKGAIKIGDHHENEPGPFAVRIWGKPLRAKLAIPDNGPVTLERFTQDGKPVGDPARW